MTTRSPQRRHNLSRMVVSSGAAAERYWLAKFQVKVRSATPPTWRICSVIAAGIGIIGLKTSTPLR